MELRVSEEKGLSMDILSFSQVAEMFNEYVHTHDVTGMSTSDILKEILFKEVIEVGPGKEGKGNAGDQSVSH